MWTWSILFGLLLTLLVCLLVTEHKAFFRAFSKAIIVIILVVVVLAVMTVLSDPSTRSKIDEAAVDSIGDVTQMFRKLVEVNFGIAMGRANNDEK